jgi:hypothetical protein
MKDKRAACVHPHKIYGKAGACTPKKGNPHSKADAWVLTCAKTHDKAGASEKGAWNGIIKH